MKKSALVLLFCSQMLFAEQPLKFRVIENKAQMPLLNPELALRKTLKIEIANGLQVLLISDPNTDKSAAALAVEAGSWNDPKEYPGMAHFLEHMLFMGTEAYPKEFEYMHYITDHSGNINAYTAPDRTVYLFSINSSAFEGALNRFSHFFIDPLFPTSGINRELHAVDQEHSKNIENDGWRQYMIFKETGNPNHPNSSFSTGNASTLSNIPQEALKKWYEKNYSANKMHLVMLSPLPLNEMTKLAVSNFSSVPNRPSAQVDLTEKMTSPSQLGHITYIKPVRDWRKLSLNWELPPDFSTLEGKKYAELLAYVLGSEDEKSLLTFLKKEKIAEHIDVQVEPLGQKNILFSINIDLTVQGVSQIDKTLLNCFQMLARIRENGIPGYLFEEMKKLATINYQYQARQDAFGFVMGYAHNMVDESLSTFPENSFIPKGYSPSTLKELLEHLTVQNGFYSVIADPKLTGIAPDTKEKWMDAEYTIREIPASTFLACQEAKPVPFLNLPGQNPYIPGSLKILSEAAEKKLPSPIILSDDDGEKIYYSSDSYYKVPETSYIFSLKSPLLDGSPRASVLEELYLTALREKLSSSLNFASQAGLHVFFLSDPLQVEIAVQGFSDKAPKISHDVFKNLQQVHPSREDFDIYKQQHASRYQNFEKELAVQQALEALSHMISNVSPTNREKFEALQTITYDHFIEFSQKFSKQLYIEGILYGNLTQSQATNLWENLRNALPYTPYPVSDHIHKHVLVLPENQGPYMVQQTTDMQGNGLVLAIQEGPFSFEKRACQQVLAKVLQETFFDTLRTKQQTAYIVRAWDNEIEKQLFQLFAIQSSSHLPLELLGRFELILENFQKSFEDCLSEERFETIRSMLVKTLEIPPENLQGMANLLHTLAFEYDADFLFVQKRIDALKSLTYEQVKAFTMQNLSRKNHKRLASLVEGVIANDNEFRYERVAKDDVRKIGEYITSKD